MMLLDVGNSSVKWAIWEESGLASRGRFTHLDKDFAQRATGAWGELPEPAAVAVANVAGAGMEQAITAWTREKWNITPRYLRASGTAAGVKSAYTVAGNLGVDRWAAMVAAYREFECPVCIIDCGTAITIDVVSADGVHRGGLIMPGIGIMKRSLVEDTAGISVEFGDNPAPETLLAMSTRDAVNNGVVYMAAAVVDRIMVDFAATPGENTEIIITGGDADYLLPLLIRQPRHDPCLVLKGVAILAGDSVCAT